MIDKIKYNRKAFDRVLDNLLSLPGSIEIGTTTDVGDRYIAYRPHDESPHYFRFIFGMDSVTMDTSITVGVFSGEIEKEGK